MCVLCVFETKGNKAIVKCIKGKKKTCPHQGEAEPLGCIVVSLWLPTSFDNHLQSWKLNGQSLRFPIAKQWANYQSHTTAKITCGAKSACNRGMYLDGCLTRTNPIKQLSSQILVQKQFYHGDAITTIPPYLFYIHFNCNVLTWHYQARF